MKAFLMFSTLLLWTLATLCGGKNSPGPASGSSTSSQLPADSGSSPVAASESSGGQQNPSQQDVDLLKSFDEYLRINLDDVYYRLSYAFDDATKRTLEKCGCAP